MRVIFGPLLVAVLSHAAVPAQAQDKAQFRAASYDVSDVSSLPPGWYTLCAMVSSMEEPWAKDSPYKYHYQDFFHEQAGFKSDDDLAARTAKIQSVVPYLRKVTCRTSDFSRVDRNVIKYAVHKNFDTFIYEIFSRYKIDVNMIDPGDGMTVLDYLSERLAVEEEIGSPLVPTFKKYMKWMVDGGAKRRKDIDGWDCTFAFVEYERFRSPAKRRLNYERDGLRACQNVRS